MSSYIVRPPDGDEPWVAEGSLVSLQVEPGGKAFQRVGLKGIGGPAPYEVRWLVGELDGVKVYIDTRGDHVNLILTRKDLNP